ncbi:MAG: hypothetical protein ACJ76N_30935 [Thermoanaerobaculia bacterium]
MVRRRKLADQNKMSNQKTRYADHVTEWEDLTTSMATHAAELPQLEIQRAALEKMLEKARSLTTQQADFQAQKQEVSKELQTTVREGIKLATVLRVSLKQHYGSQSEKLAAFGLQPFRGRKAKPAETPTPQPASPPVPQTSPTPTLAHATAPAAPVE